MMEGNCVEIGAQNMAEKERELIEENHKQLASIPIKLLTDAEQEVKGYAFNISYHLFKSIEQVSEGELICSHFVAQYH